jgi:hypothetical protein
VIDGNKIAELLDEILDYDGIVVLNHGVTLHCCR